MPIGPIQKISDGDYEILFSSTFNVYEKKLIFEKIGDYTFIFQFEKDSTKQGSPLNISGNDEGKIATITLVNFYNPLGVGTIKMVPILKTQEGKQVYFSIYAKSLNETTEFLEVSVTFYLK